jgi:fatty acid desaturase
VRQLDPSNVDADLEKVKREFIRKTWQLYGGIMCLIAAPLAVFTSLHGPLLLQVVVCAFAMFVLFWLSHVFALVMWEVAKDQARKTLLQRHKQARLD